MKIQCLAFAALILLHAHSPANGPQETPTTVVPFQSIGPASPQLGNPTVHCEAYPTPGVELTWMLLTPDLGLQDHSMLGAANLVPMLRFTLVHSIQVPGDLLPHWHGFVGNLEDFESPDSGPCAQEPKPAQAAPAVSSGCTSLLLRVGQDGLLAPTAGPRLLTFGLCDALPTVRVRIDG